MVELALVGEKSPVSRPIFEEREELLAERLRPPLLLCRLHDLVERDVHLARAGVLVDGEEVVGEHDQATLVKQLGTGIFFFLNGVCVCINNNIRNVRGRFIRCCIKIAKIKIANIIIEN